jgi:hypothetical protein
MAVLTDRGRATRAKEIENAVASVRIEGLEPSDDARIIFQRYVDGELTSDELDRAFACHLDHAYGPVRLSRHERP